MLWLNVWNKVAFISGVGSYMFSGCKYRNNAYRRWKKITSSLHFDGNNYIFAADFGETKAFRPETLKGNPVRNRNSARYCNIRSIRIFGNLATVSSEMGRPSG